MSSKFVNKDTTDLINALLKIETVDECDSCEKIKYFKKLIQKKLWNNF